VQRSQHFLVYIHIPLSQPNAGHEQKKKPWWAGALMFSALGQRKEGFADFVEVL
jgi:hypothetical protein